MAKSANSFSSGENRWFAVGLYTVIVVLLFASFVFQLWYHATRTSATVDESPHILAGHRHWQCGDFGINPEHPPLLKLLATVPLISRTLIEPNWDCGSKITSKPDSFLFGTKFIIQNGVDEIVIPVRLSAALMSLLLAALVFLAAWQMFGRWEALTALALLAFEPNLIANGSLVTTDMAIAATAFAAVYALYRFRQKPNVFRFVTVGLAVGLMLAAKHSAVIFVPILFVLLIADVAIFRRNEMRLPKRILQQTAAFAGFFLIGLILLWAFYGFRYRAIPGGGENTISIENYIKENSRRPEIADSLSAKIVASVNQTRIFPESYILGIADVVATGSRNTWIFDRNYSTGQWFYFPLAFIVKSSVALLLLLPLGLLFPFFNPEKRREVMFLLVPSLLFFAVSLTSGLNIGVRHILPVYPFFVVIAAAGAVWAGRKFHVFRYILIALLLFHAATAVRTAPNYIAFANDFWGGTNNTYRIFREANVDFGQNTKLAGEYLARENISDCWFASQGNVELTRVSQPCRLMPGSFPGSVTDEPDEPVPPVIEGTVLLGVLSLPPRGGNEYVPITQSQPIAQIGGSVFVYRGRFEIPLAAALSHAERANQFVRLKRFEEAVADGRKAIELAPNDSRTHLSLGIALARAGQKDEARREFETTIEVAKLNPSLFRNAEVRAQQEIERLN
ncbi:MAG: glycosyltransferase family 39 protein [Pyrinomonadaceae bacterium]|nr:glycosyltransferase family 39 protein [Pyrinomonadaceae bacterium]